MTGKTDIEKTAEDVNKNAGGIIALVITIILVIIAILWFSATGGSTRGCEDMPSICRCRYKRGSTDCAPYADCEGAFVELCCQAMPHVCTCNQCAGTETCEDFYGCAGYNSPYAALDPTCWAASC